MAKVVTGMVLGGLALALAPNAAVAQGGAPLALKGEVSSTEEGAMEGVLVSARKDESTITVTVVSDDKGQYAFPADRLSAGHYSLAIRAVGYALQGNGSVDVPVGSGAARDLKLVKAKSLANQLTNAEWLMSMPGEDQKKAFLTNCVGCHTLQRIFASTHDAAEFRQVFKRMGTYSPESTPTHPQKLLPGPRGERPAVAEAQAGPASELLARANLSATDTWDYPLKTLARPKGRATKVIITEFDLPRKDAAPHDVIAEPAGARVWYSDFGAQVAGFLEPATGKATDIPIPTLKPDEPKGSLQIEFDPAGNVWLAMMYQAGLTHIDAKTLEVKTYPFPKDWQSTSAQNSMVSPQHSDVDGKVWTNNQDSHDSYRFDLKTGTYENLGQSRDPSGRQVSGYGMPTDAQNNLYLLEFGGAEIGRVDAKTHAVEIIATPSPRSRPRRGRVDDEGRLWFAEYGANAIAMYDPETGAIKEWRLPIPWSDPYDVAAAKNGEVWTGSMLTDRVSRLDPKTDDIVDYLLPRPTNIRRVFVQATPHGNVLWVGSNRGASIVKVEPQ